MDLVRPGPGGRTRLPRLRVPIRTDPLPLPFHPDGPTLPAGDSRGDPTGMQENEPSGVPGPLIRLGQVPSLAWLPRRTSKPPSIATVHRRVSAGIRGQKLRAIQAGGALATTELWLMQFFQALTDSAAPATAPRRKPTRSEFDREQARRELEAAGI